MAKYAVLMSGGINFNSNYMRYKNDLEFIYQVLVEDCDFQSADIKILYANGRELEYQGSNLFTEEATLANFKNSLCDATVRLDEEDEFLLAVTNHGGIDCGGCINLWETEVMPLWELVDALSHIKARKILILGECFAGNILQYHVENACILTANMSGMCSFTNPNRPDYDEFLYHFFAYIHDGYPDGMAMCCQGENDIHKAFQYAVDMDVLSPNSQEGDRIRALYGADCVEIPQMKCDIKGKLSL